eukprot:COSAG02_NODE_17117_length_1027_cov_1.029095_1_plen_126_part_00
MTFDNKARSIQVLDTAGAEVGGREIDVLLAERFREIAEATQPGLVLEPNIADRRVLRARQRIFSATDESKKVLSANDTDTAMLEELAEGLDVRARQLLVAGTNCFVLYSKFVDIGDPCSGSVQHY